MVKGTVKDSIGLCGPVAQDFQVFETSSKGLGASGEQARGASLGPCEPKYLMARTNKFWTKG